MYDLGHGVKITAPAHIYVNLECDRTCPIGDVSSASEDFSQYSYKKVALNANGSGSTRFYKFPRIASALSSGPQDWFHAGIAEVLIYDKHIELATTGSIEFEDVDLGEMMVEVQGRILEVRRRLELQLTCPKAKRKTMQSKGQRSYRVTGRGTNLFPRILSPKISRGSDQ